MILLGGTTASAIGITGQPNPEAYLFEPGKELVFDYVVFGFSEDAALTLEGEFAQYAAFSAVENGTGTRSFRVTVRFPEELPPPGIYNLFVGAQEVRKQTGMVSAVAAVRKQIRFRVLYPFKLISARFITPSVNLNEPVNFQVNVKSETVLPIYSVRADIDIFDSNNNKIGSVTTNTVELQMDEQKQLTALFQTTGLKPATYTAVAQVNYDGNTTSLRNEFRIGTLSLKVIWSTTEFIKDTINKFDIEVESGWNDRIKDVFAEVFVEDRFAFKTPTSDIEPWQRINLTGYWDTKNVTEGNHTATITVFFANESITKTSTLSVIGGEKKAGLSMKWVIVGAAALVLVLITLANIVLFFAMRKAVRKEGKREVKEKPMKKK